MQELLKGSSQQVSASWRGLHSINMVAEGGVEGIVMIFCDEDLQPEVRVLGL